MDGDTTDGETATRAARHGPFTWRRLVLAAALGLSLTSSQGTMAEYGAPGTAQASPLVAEADLQVSLGNSVWHVAPNDGFSYRVTVANAGDRAVPAVVETVLPPVLGNVTVAASGFSCVRQFEAGGSQPGTAVVCTSWEPLAPGATAGFTVRARAAASPGTYRIVAAVAEEGAGDEDGRTAAELRVGS